jgi:CRISP-associated protein Cas1
MKRHLNTLFVTTQGSYLAKEGETIAVRHEEETRLRVPIHTLGSVACFGQVSASPYLLGFCAERGVAVSFLSENGRFLARLLGPTSGNVLLRREQYRRTDDAGQTAALVAPIVAAKLLNSRDTLLRAARNRPEAPAAEPLRAAAESLRRLVVRVSENLPVDVLRGLEGEGARTYFSAFDHLVTQQKEHFFFRERSRRPPLDNLNALLSFSYTLLRHDVESALEAVGLDPQVGFLHRERPGRPSLALDLAEELRSFLADRVVLSLVNQQQVKPSGFVAAETGGVTMDEATRKAVLVAWQKRKQEELEHPFLKEKTTVGLLPHLQALLLARHLRGDLDAYPPFLSR